MNVITSSDNTSVSNLASQSKSSKLVSANRGVILVVSQSNKINSELKNIIVDIGFEAVMMEDGEQALSVFENSLLSYIMVDANLKDLSSAVFVDSISERAIERNIPIVVLASDCDERILSHCVDAGCDDFLFAPFSSFSVNARITSLEQMRDLKYLYKDSIEEQLFAKRILDNALEERNLEFEDIGVLRKSKSVFSGDLFLTARHPEGSLNILMADFTGHGLSAAIGALPVADVFNTMTHKGFDLDYILENINSKLYSLLPTSMFMACSVINISNDLTSIKVWNGGMPEIYVREKGTGQIAHKIESKHIPLGIDKEILNRFDLETIHITPGDQLILYTDGLAEAVNANQDMFGYQYFEQCLLINKKEDCIFTSLVDGFSEFCGDIKPEDDVTLACVSCTPDLMNTDSMKTGLINTGLIKKREHADD